MKRLAPDGIFTGYLVGNGLATAFASADLFAFPSTTDTFGNVILEAMASGLPCVVSDQGGPRELVQPGQTGTITASLNVESFTAGLRELIVQPQRRLAMRENARRSVEHRDWSDAAAKFWAMSGE
jgi:glycosyltransferase involved in cell wall biosynthesis